MQDNLQIRPYHPSDIPHIMDICLRTANNGTDATESYSDPWFIGQLFALPYLIHHSCLCFTACINEKPMGYILGTKDSTAFYSWMETEFLPPLRKRYPADMDCQSPLESMFVQKLHSDWDKEEIDASYPAHLHIDLLRDIQGQGAGKQLINIFLKALREEHLPGVHLGVSRNNVRAVKFYLKIGFQEAEKNEGAITMVQQL